MKNYLAYLLILSGVIYMSSCNKGDTGPQGATGPTGPAGSNINIVVDTFTINGSNSGASNWVSFGTQGTSSAYVQAQVTSSDLDNSVVNGNGAVFLYYTNGNGYWYSLPQVFYDTTTYNYTITYSYTVDTLDIQRYDSDLQPVAPQLNTSFRLVIIPGTQKTAYPVNFKDWNAVEKYFHITYKPLNK